MRKWIVRYFGLLALAAIASCGGGDGSEEVNPYAGSFSVLESYKTDTVDTQCLPPPIAALENSLEITIAKNQLKVVFTDRWGTLLGEFHPGDLTFLSVDTQNKPDESFTFSGAFQDENTLQAILTHTRPGCTRLYDVEGTRGGT